MVQVICNHHKWIESVYTDSSGNKRNFTQCAFCGQLDVSQLQPNATSNFDQQKEDVPNTEVEKKAKELVEKYWKQIYYDATPVNWNKEINGKENVCLIQVKNCALIAVDEILNLNPKIGLQQEEFYNQVKLSISKM